MKKIAIDVLLWVLASPILFMKFLVRLWQRMRFFDAVGTPWIVCECGTPMHLIGLWQCNCGFTYRGHLLVRCPVCLSVPRVVRCYACGVTTPLPRAPE